MTPSNKSDESTHKLIEEARSRQLYYQRLFRIYEELPFAKLVPSFFKIFNDVFTNERPITVQRYFLTEVKVCEMTKCHTFKECFAHNFLPRTVKEVTYSNSEIFAEFLRKACLLCKLQDQASVSLQELHRRGRKSQPHKLRANQVQKPQNGTELFFSNVMVKIY